MYGISWSAINSLILSFIQGDDDDDINILQYLKAIFIFDASDDLYYNDVHYIDGSIHIDPDYMIYTDHMMSFPSSINPVIDNTFYNDRFNTKPWLITYIEHQNDGEWWRNKSVDFIINNVNIAAYLWSGQLDGYKDYNIHLWNKLQSINKIKLTIGPWNTHFLQLHLYILKLNGNMKHLDGLIYG